MENYKKVFAHFCKKNSIKPTRHFEVRSVDESVKEKTDSSLPLRMTERKCAFTLAETIIVVTVLGLVAAITVPAVIKRHAEMEKRMKIRKSMTVYDHAINKMVIENGIKDKTTLITFAGDENNNCKNSTNFFNKTDGNGCRFKTSDGIWWNIKDITKPIVAFSEDDLTYGPNIPKSFGFYAWFDNNGSLRVDDLRAIENYEQASETDKENLAKLYKYLAGEKIKEIKDYEFLYLKYLNGEYNNECVNPDDDNLNCTNCKGCKVEKMISYISDDEMIVFKTIYDDNGNIIFNNNMEGSGEVYIRDKNGKILTTMVIGGQDCSVSDANYINLCKDYGYPVCEDTWCQVEDYH